MRRLTSATGVLIVGFAKDWREFAGPILAGWIPVIYLFLSGQAALRSIVTTGKWRTLDELQSHISDLQVHGDMAKQETIDAINRLVDLQERVVATRNSASSVRAALITLKDLLLPILAAALAIYAQLQTPPSLGFDRK